MSNITEIVDALQSRTNALKARFPGVTFGYIGNVGVDRSGPFDDRSWYVFLPTGGSAWDRVGGYSTDRLAVMLENWPKIEAAVERALSAK